MKTRRAFTLIEVLVATAIIALVATSAAINFTKARVTSRDGRRKSDLHTYSQAIQAYQLATTNYFVADTHTTGLVCKPDTVADPTQDPLQNADLMISSSAANRTGCTGANGHAYGLLNASNATVGNSISSYSLNGASNGARTYMSESIATALHNDGYLSNVATDPLSKTDQLSYDYILLRCCKDGRQSVGTGAQAFSVWSRLEGTVDTSESATASHICGGSATALSVDANITNNASASKLAGFPTAYYYDYGNGTGGTGTTTGGFVYGVGTAIGTTGYAPCTSSQKAG